MAIRLRVEALMTAALVTASLAAASPAVTPTVSLTLVNNAGAEAKTRAQAMARVASMYRQAGVELVEKPQDSVRAAGDLRLYVLLQTTAPAWEPAGERLVLGRAALPAEGCGRLAYAYHDRIVSFAAAHGYDASIVLAAVIAHEVGHLLLPRGAHGTAGVMKERLTPEDFDAVEAGGLGFLTHQAAAMQRQVRDEIARIGSSRDHPSRMAAR